MILLKFRDSDTLQDYYLIKCIYVDICIKIMDIAKENDIVC